MVAYAIKRPDPCPVLVFGDCGSTGFASQANEIARIASVKQDNRTIDRSENVAPSASIAESNHAALRLPQLQYGLLRRVY